jgi:hypothetical protein
MMEYDLTPQPRQQLAAEVKWEVQHSPDLAPLDLGTKMQNSCAMLHTPRKATLP